MANGTPTPESGALPTGGAAIALGAGALLTIALMLSAGLVGVGGFGLSFTSGGGEGSSETAVSALARREIPAEYLRLYQQAGWRYGIDWAVLAAIGRVECDHGRDPDPSCTRRGASEPGGCGWADAVPGIDLGALRGGR